MAESRSRTIDLPTLSFRAAISPSSINAEDRTVDVTFSTGVSLRRYDWATGERYIEKLSMDPAHVRLERLNSGAPVLDSHSGYSLSSILGVVEEGSAKLSGKKGIATLRFSRRPDVEPRWMDINDRVIRNVSMGYIVHAYQETPGKNGGLPTRLATDWEPHEISMVAMPVDIGAQTRSGKLNFETHPCQITTNRDTELEEPQMAEEKPEQTEQPVQKREALTPTDTPSAPAVVATPVVQPTTVADATVARAAEEARGVERARITGIHQAVRIAKLESSLADDMIARGISIDKAREEIFAKLAANQPGPSDNATHIRMGEDERDKFIRAATNALVVRSGVAEMVAKAENPQNPPRYEAGEFRSFSLYDFAAECVERSGMKTRGLDRMTIVGHAFTRSTITQSTSDFVILLENVMHKVLQAAYATQPDTWSRFSNRSTVTDFRPHARYRMGMFGALDSLNENGEFKNKAINDAEKATIQAATKGNIINVSRQMIVNDDLSAFTRLLSMLGRAAALSVEIDVYSLLLQNGGLGPTLSDGNPLFHANSHHNISVGTVLSVDGIDQDRVVMAQQLDPWGNEFLDLRPAVLLVPITLGGTARVINDAQYDVTAGTAFQVPNKVRGLFRDVVDSPRLSGTRRYLFADPNVAPVLEVAFLEGQTAPLLESRDGWRVDGTEMRVRFDYGTAAVDYRGAVTSTGTDDT